MMAHQSTKPTLAELQAELADADYKVRKEAIKRIMRYHKQKAVEPLLLILTDRRADIRAKAVEALGKLKDTRALVPLLGLLADKHMTVRVQVVRALGNFQDRSVIRPLQDLLRDPEARLRQAAATSLGQLGMASALPALLDYLECCWLNAAELFSAARAVCKFDSPGVIPPLLALCKRADFVQGVIAEALSYLGETSTPVLLEILVDREQFPEVRCCVAQALARKPRPASLQPLLQAIGDGEARLRELTAQALGTLGEAAASEPLIALLLDPDDGVCRAAITALGELRAFSATGPLIACLSTRHTQEITSAACQVLDQLNVPNALPALIQAFDRWYELYDHLYAGPCWPLINALIKLGGPALVDELLVRLPNSLGSRRWIILFMLWRFPSSRLVEPLLACLDPLPSDLYAGHLQQEIINLLAQIGDARAVEPLRQVRAQAPGELYDVITSALAKLETATLPM